MINNIEFCRVENEFQNRMREDTKNIKKCGKVVMSADKSTNLYKISKSDYEQYLTNSITSDYKKVDSSKIDCIDKGAYDCAQKLQLADRIKKLETSEAYITVKDHKEDFNAKPSFRLINPSKQEIGKISKQLIEDINT